jgi:type II secretory ATPase GspE/PulE/Tfp pilus assembly ATPase PilB-like protein
MPEVSTRAPVALPAAPEGSVTLGLLDGRTMSGQLTSFAPDASDIALEVGGQTREIVPAAGVAYVAFHYASNDPMIGAESGAEPYRIHAVGGTTFSVLARPTRGSAFGFRAVPREAKSPYAEFYFYSHGVRAREKDQPLGLMLVKSGAIHPDALEHAVVAQRIERAVPIGKILVDTLQITEADVARTMALQKTTNQRIGELLIKQGLATPKQVEEALAEQRRRRSRRLGETLLDLNIVSEETLARTLAKKFDLAFFDLDRTPPDLDAVAAVPRDIIERHGIVPVKKTASTLVVAISDPLTSDGLDEIRAATSLQIEEAIATPGALKRCIDELFERSPSLVVETDNSEFEVILHGIADAPPLLVNEPVSEQPHPLVAFPPTLQPATIDPVTIESAGLDPIEDLVCQIVREAEKRGASHVHLEANGPNTLVRFRINGRCVTQSALPEQQQRAVPARFKTMAGIDGAAPARPRTGKARLRVGDRDVELSIAAIPTVDEGEDLVVRLLSPPRLFTLSDLALSEQNLKNLGTLIENPGGLLLCVGPSGCGKTTTLHAVAGALNARDSKIWAAEERVEVRQDGVRQLPIDPARGFGLAPAIRVLVEADADVILVASLRDVEVARAAIDAALGGRRILSTLPARRAIEAVVRLLHMELDPFDVADGLTGVLGQRLIRRLCGSCKQERAAKPGENEIIGEIFSLAPAVELWSAPGCAACNGTGYEGLIAVHELLIPDGALRRAIARRAPIEELERLASDQRMRSIAQDAMLKALAGHTDLQQVLTVR